MEKDRQLHFHRGLVTVCDCVLRDSHQTDCDELTPEETLPSLAGDRVASVECPRAQTDG